jgi:hypothetical protein
MIFNAYSDIQRNKYNQTNNWIHNCVMYENINIGYITKYNEKELLMPTDSIKNTAFVMHSGFTIDFFPILHN